MQPCYNRTNQHTKKITRFPKWQAQRSNERLWRLLLLLQQRSVMNKTVPLTGIFIVPRQKLNYFWPQWYQCFSCTIQSRSTGCMFSTCQCGPAPKELFLTSIMPSHWCAELWREWSTKIWNPAPAAFTRTCERLEKTRAKLSQGESNDKASLTAASGGVNVCLLGLKQLHSVSLLETQKQKLNGKKTERGGKFLLSKCSFKRSLPWRSFSARVANRVTCELGSMTFLFAKSALYL